jgi:uncharacterized cysteine cluster protein YcgN (CxxCxxCC family)
MKRRIDAEAAPDRPFWETKPLEALDKAEWESLCDGCGRCCLVKLEDDDTGTVHLTSVGCRLLNSETCRCSDYRQRRRRVRDCIKLTPDLARTLAWLPPTCAYRLIGEGRRLQWWHPLVSGSPETVHEAGISVRGRVAASECELELDDYPNYIVNWPRNVPKAARLPSKRRALPEKCRAAVAAK